MRQWIGNGTSWVAPIFLVSVLSACSQAPLFTSQEAPPKVTEQASEATLSQSVPLATTGGRKDSTESKAIAQGILLSAKTNQRLAGFSRDGKFFIYLESWRDTGAGIPQAAIQIIDISTNTCVPKGCAATQYREGDDQVSLEMAEQSLLRQTQSLRQALQLDSPTPGMATAMTTQARTADGAESVIVQTGGPQPLQIDLKQQRVVSVMDGGTADRDKTAMQLDVIDGNQRRSLASLNQFHDGVMAFSIREVILTPDGKQGVILLTSAQRSFEGNLGRTMVQGFEL